MLWGGKTGKAIRIIFGVVSALVALSMVFSIFAYAFF
jgi:hypothetical protein